MAAAANGVTRFNGTSQALQCCWHRLLELGPGFQDRDKLFILWVLLEGLDGLSKVHGILRKHLKLIQLPVYLSWQHLLGPITKQVST